MAQFEIRPMEMEQTAREIDAKINEWQNSVNRLYQYASELDAMWEGDANEAFNKTFGADRPKYNNLTNLMSEYKTALEALNVATALKFNAGTNGVRNKATLLGVGIDAITECCAMLDAALVAMNAPEIINEMTKLREIVDNLEQVVDDQKWPLPKYREMLFLY